MRWGSKQHFTGTGIFCLVMGIALQWPGTMWLMTAFNNMMVCLYVSGAGFLFISLGIVILVINSLRVE
ncbi:MAG: hypothetical protein SA339_11705 [Methanomassiliicoccus sp.]|nr:hypothetical protein [Methanomassiliicoccus sp.]